MNHAEKADTLAALPGNTKGNRREGGEMKAFYIETYEGLIRDDADFMTPTEFIKANRQGTLGIDFFPPKCILNEFCISEIELYDIINDENKEYRLFTNRELEFREGKRFLIDDIFYAFSLEYDQLTINIADYVSWKTRHKKWCEEKKIIKEQLEEALKDNPLLEIENEQLKTRITELETEFAACQKQLEEARRGNTSGMGEHGLCSLVIRMREEGKTEEEIAAFLNDNKKWCTASQVGALLHRGGRVTADAMLKHGQRLLGKA